MPRKPIFAYIREDAAARLAGLEAATDWSAGQIAAEMLTMMADCPPSQFRRVLGVLEHAIRALAPATPCLDNPTPRHKATREQVNEARRAFYEEKLVALQEEMKLRRAFPLTATVSASEAAPVPASTAQIAMALPTPEPLHLAEKWQRY